MRPLILILLLTAFTGCFEKGECLDQTSNQTTFRFFNMSDFKERSLLIDSIRVEGLAEARYEDTELSSVTLPLNPLNTQAVITVYQPAGTCVITLDYSTQTTLLDPACGAAELYTLKAVRVEGADSVKIIQPILSSVSTTEHVRLFF